MIKRLLIYIIIVGTSIIPIKAQSDEENVFEQLLSLQTDSVTQYLVSVETKSVTHLKLVNYTNLINTLTHFSEDKVKRFFEIQKEIEEGATLLNNSDKVTVLYLDVFLNNLIVSAITANKYQLFKWSYKYHRTLNKLSDNTDAQILKHRAIQQILYAVVINEIPFSEILLKGDFDKNTGLKLITTAKGLTNNKVDQMEILVWEKLFKLYFTNSASNIDKELANDYALIRLFDMLQARKLKQNDIVLDLCQLNTSADYKHFPFFYLIEAEALLKRNDQKCIQMYQFFLDSTQSELFLSMAYKQYNWANGLFSGNKDPNIGQYCPNNWLATDRYYSNEKDFNVAHRPLLEARLLFDGGYYQKALDILIAYSKKDISNHYQEYHYRIGRIYHELEMYPEAIQSYDRAISAKHGTDELAAKACYFAGVLGYNNGYLNIARYYFDKLLGYQNFPFEQALKSDAKGILKSME